MRQVPKPNGGRKMRKTLIFLKIPAAGLLVLLTILPAITIASSDNAVVGIIGEEGFKANSRVFATFRFSPGNIHINRGGVITFQNLVTNDTHTISIVNEPQLPTTVSQVFMCGAPGTVCAAIFAAHIPNGFNPVTMQPNPPVYPFVNVPGNPSGFTEGNVQGNSQVIMPGQTVDITISAQSGTTLHYLCAIHAWMQGTIVVK